MKQRKAIGLREIRALEPGSVVWDESLAGFGVRRQRGSAVTYVLKYRTADNRQRWHTIGRHGALTPDEARKEAKRLLGDVARGADPGGEKKAKRKAATVGELCDQYLEAAQAGRVLTRAKVAKKAGTLLLDKGRIERHIKPLLGNVALGALTRDDVERFLHDVAEGRTAGNTKTKKQGLARVTGGRTTATRTVGLLGAILTYAVRRGMRVDNPARGVELFADRKRDRRLSDEEYAAFGRGLRKAETVVWPPAIAAARFIALTGWRRGEALGLHWKEIDLSRRTATLGDTKTGRSMRPLSEVACELLNSLNRTSDLVFPASRGDGQMTGFPKLWTRMMKLGDIGSDVTPHVLRHSFASLAGDLGYSEPTIAALIGHKGRSVTSRYVHAADAVLLAAANAVAAETIQRLAPGLIINISSKNGG